MDDYLTSVAEAVRDACAETCNEQHTIAERRPIPATICAMHIGHIDLPAIIASVPRPETVSNNAISQLLCAVQYYGSCKWSEGMGLIADPTLADVRAAWDGVYESVQSLYAEPVAAQVAVPEQWQAVARECVSHLDDGRTQPALSRSLRKLSAMLDSSVAPPVSVSHGWKLVPVEPTPGMLMAAGAAVHAATYWHRAYCAMLAVVPEALQTIQCNACDWIGSSADALYLGGREPIGPLCPECHETTGPADGAATLRSAIRAMASMLQAREWAEHVSTDPDVTDLEVQITELVGTATKLREQNAALVAALMPFAFICKEGLVTKNYVTVTTCAEYFNRAEKVLAALASAEGSAA